MADWAPWNWDSGNWQNAAKGGMAGFMVGGPAGAAIGAYGGGALLPDGQQPYKTAQAGAQNASGQLQALSQLQWDRQMQGLQQAQAPLNNYRTLYDRIYGTNTANSAASNPQPFGGAPPAGAASSMMDGSANRTPVQAPIMHGSPPTGPVIRPQGPIFAPPTAPMPPPQPMYRPTAPIMGAGSSPLNTLAANNRMGVPMMGR